MGDLSQLMQERLEKWRKKTLVVPTTEKLKKENFSLRRSKGDYGDALSIDEWEDEAQRSQNRK